MDSRDNLREQNPMIPMKIHFIWLGGPIPASYMQSILDICQAANRSGFSVSVWVDNENNITKSKFYPEHLALEHRPPGLTIRDITELFTRIKSDAFYQTENRATMFSTLLEREFIGLKNYAAASDILRYEILRQEGGYYFDTDTVFIPACKYFVRSTAPTKQFIDLIDVDHAYIRVSNHRKNISALYYVDKSTSKPKCTRLLSTNDGYAAEKSAGDHQVSVKLNALDDKLKKEVIRPQYNGYRLNNHELDAIRAITYHSPTLHLKAEHAEHGILIHGIPHSSFNNDIIACVPNHLILEYALLHVFATYKKMDMYSPENMSRASSTFYPHGSMIDPENEPEKVAPKYSLTKKTFMDYKRDPSHTDMRTYAIFTGHDRRVLTITASGPNALGTAMQAYVHDNNIRSIDSFYFNHLKSHWWSVLGMMATDPQHNTWFGRNLAKETKKSFEDPGSNPKRIK